MTRAGRGRDDRTRAATDRPRIRSLESPFDEKTARASAPARGRLTVGSASAGVGRARARDAASDARSTRGASVGMSSPMPPVPPPPPSALNACDIENVACVNTDVADAEVMSAFAAYVALSIAVLVAFGILRDKVPIYTGRALLRTLRASGTGPRLSDLARGGGLRGAARRIFGWIPSVLSVSDEELVRTAGLDALVFLRIAQFGTQLFAPLALVGVFGLVPLHLSRSFYTTTVTERTNRGTENHVLMRMTIANVEPKSELMWVHVCVFWVFVAYALWLLDRHYRSWEFLRQVYGTTTGESNPWRAVHIPQTVFQKLLQQGMDTRREFATDMNRGESTTVPSRVSADFVTVGDAEFRTPPQTLTRRHSSTILPSSKESNLPKRTEYQKFTPDSTEIRSPRLNGPSSVDDVEWPVLLEVLMGPTTNAEDKMSTEQKLRRFPRTSFVDHGSRSISWRGYHSHIGPLESVRSAPAQKLSRMLSDESVPPRRDTRHRSRPSDVPESPESSASVSEISVTGVSDSEEGGDVDDKDVESESDDTAIKHKWWEGLDIAEEAWGAELNSVKRNRASRFGSNEVLSVPQTMEIDVEMGPHRGKAGIRGASVPSIDDRRYISAIAEEIDEDGAKQEFVVSVLVQNYCVLMTDVGSERGVGDPWEDMRAVEKFFKGMFPDDFLMVIPIQDYRLVDDLLTERDRLANKVEKLGIQRARRIRPHQGALVRDQITDLREKMASIDHLIVRERSKIRLTQPGPSCIVAFQSQYAAACAAQCRITSRHRDLFSIEPAPGPDNINWQAVLLRRRQREFRSAVIFPFILAIILIPTGMFTGVMSSLCVANQFGAKQSSALEWYCSNDRARYLRILVQGILPPILLTLWETFIISFGMMYLVQAQSKHSSLSKTDESFAEYYFLWAFLNVFSGTVSGYAIQRYLNALNTKGPDAMLQLLGTSLPLTSNFFLLWIVFRGVYLPTQRLIFPHPGVLCMAVNRWCCCLGCNVTARDRTIKYSPRAIRLGREVGVFSMVMMIGLVFSTVAPLITLLCTVFFVFNFIIWRYHALYVYERSYEAGGTMWNTFCNLTIYALLIAQSFLSFVLLSKHAYAGALFLWITVLPVLSRASYRFKSLASELRWSVPLPQAATAPRVEFNAETYIHPALTRHSMGWHPEIGKVWRGYPNVTVKETRIFR